MTAFLQQNFFYGFPIPERTASTSPSCLQSLPSHELLTVQCSKTKHLTTFVLQGYILTSLQAALTGPAKRNS